MVIAGNFSLAIPLVIFDNKIITFTVSQYVNSLYALSLNESLFSAAQSQFTHVGVGHNDNNNNDRHAETQFWLNQSQETRHVCTAGQSGHMPGLKG